MALIKCKECKAEISNKANKCPSCGAPIMPELQKILLGGCLTVVVVAFLIFIGVIISLPKNTTNTDSQTSETQPIENVKETAQEPALLSDQEIAKNVTSQIKAIEEDWNAQNESLKDLLNKVISKGKAKQGESDNVQIYINEIDKILNRAKEVNAKHLSNEKADKYLQEAVDAHKKWALLQQLKINALMSGDLQMAKNLASQSDKTANDEAIELMMTFQELGITPE